MRKSLTMVLGTVFCLSVASTALAASGNLFTVIPEHHWSYSAVSQLAKAGIVDGFGGVPYRDDVILTRVEMAAIVAKAVAKVDKVSNEDRAVIKKLQTEFASELNLDIRAGADTSTESRLAKLEKSKSSVKLSGDTRLRYQSNWNQNAKNTDAKNTTRMEQRIRLNMASEVTENLNFLARIAATDRSNVRDVNGSNKSAKNNTISFDRAEIQWQNKDGVYSFGRILPSLGQGLLWDYNPMDGAMAIYKNDNIQYSAGYGDLAAYTASGKTTNAFFANVKMQVGSAANVTLARLDTMTNNVGNYNLEQTALGFTVKTGEIAVTAEYVKNSDDKLPTDAQDHGYWGRLQWKGIDNSKPGTYGVNFDFLALGNYAVDSYNNPGTLVVSGGNGPATGLGGNGARGYGFGLQYVIAKNANLEARYYNLKPYDQGQAGFSSYKPSYHLIGNLKF
ncbi:hypothetical protein HA075_02825 [bacterium BFN5]|nr:hypothetical protein HA075_02810 [bacterium BFN5]QJW44862.1 hypothetical protein HA075_02825 [bacterium BFN5]